MDKGFVHQQLTKLIHDDDLRAPLRLYIYDAQGYHTGGLWFRKKIRYPGEEITNLDARQRAERAIANRMEVRITNGLDNLVFHSRQGVILYPDGGWETFWQKVEAAS